MLSWHLLNAGLVLVVVPIQLRKKSPTLFAAVVGGVMLGMYDRPKAMAAKQQIRD